MRRLCLALLITALAVPAGAAPTPAERAQAKAAYETGVAHFRARAFDSAIVSFSTAYRLDPNPTLIFNMARAFEEMKSYESAIEYYRDYLDSGAATPAEQASLPTKVRTLELLATRQRGPQVVVTQTDWTIPVGWGLVAGGVAGGVVGSIFFVAADGKVDDADGLGPTQQRKFDALKGEYDDFRLYGQIAYGVGGAVMATGLVMLLWPGEEPPPVVVTPGGAGVTLMGTF